MKIGITALTDTQRLALSSGKALAEELGLTHVENLTPENVKFSEGQTVVVATPYGTKVGVIKVEVVEHRNTRWTEYVLNSEILLETRERLREDKWETLFGPDLNIPPNAALYVS